jgi:hypothetical protein
VRGLVGLELRRFLKAPPKGEEAITLTALGQLIEEAQARAQAAGGELLEQEGPRLLFGFRGESAELRAFAALSAWWDGRIGAPENAAAAALAPVKSSTAPCPRPEATATIGLPVLQVERLLARRRPRFDVTDRRGEDQRSVRPHCWWPTAGSEAFPDGGARRVIALKWHRAWRNRR